MRRGFALRLAILQLVVIALLLMVLLRLWQLQVGPNGVLESEQRDPTTEKTLSLPAPRGRILDAEGRTLVGNTGRLVLAVDRHVVDRLRPERHDALFDRLGRLLDTPAEELAARIIPCGTPGALPAPRCFDGYPYQEVPIAEKVGRRTALAVAERSDLFPGVSVRRHDVREPRRVAGAVAGHLLGYVAPATAEELDEGGVLATDLVGRAGLERQYETELRGEHGSRTVRVDVTGQVTEVLSRTPSRPGRDLRTSIDAELQAVAERELSGAVRRARGIVDPVTGRPYEADSGAVVVLDARTGRVRALAGEPSYRPEAWREALSGGDGRMLARAVQGEYAPGSTFKVVPTAAAFANGMDPDTVLPCPGTMRIGGRTFTNFRSQAYGPVDFGRALAVSCDTFFYRLAQHLWQREDGTDIASMARAFGFGRPTGVDLPAEASGSLPPEPRYPGEAALASIGQGATTVTPLQLAVAYGAIANGGTVFSPRIGAELLDPAGETVRRIEPEAVDRLPLDDAQLDALTAGLRAASTEGTAAGVFRGFDLERHPIAAKTGTAEVDGSQTTGWMATFDDRHVVVMMVGQGGTGSGACGPAVRAIWETLRS